MPILDPSVLGDHSNVQAKTSSLGLGWRSILTSVLGIAVLMSGFFWLGYWTAELNSHLRGDNLFVSPSPRRLPGPRKGPRDNPSTKKTEKAAPQWETDPDDVNRWVNL